MRLEIDIRARRGGLQLDAQASLDGPAWGLFGPSGAGKTSVLDVVAGLGDFDAGRIVLDGEVLAERPGQGRGRSVPVHKRGIGYVFQEPRLLPHCSVLGNLKYGLRRVPAGRRRLELDAIIELLKLRPLLGRPVGLLSGGEQRRASIGRAVLTSPRLLLLDEPMAGLDVAHRREILGFLRRISRELDVAMLMVSHEPEDILTVTDRVAMMDAGRIVATGRFGDAPGPIRLRRA